MKSEQRHTTNINKEAYFKYKSQSQCSQHILVLLYFFDVFLIKLVGAARSLYQSQLTVKN